MDERALIGMRRYLGGVLQDDFSAHDRDVWWSALCDVPPAHAQAVLTEVERNIKSFFSLGSDGAQIRWWAALPQSAKYDVNLLLSIAHHALAQLPPIGSAQLSSISAAGSVTFPHRGPPSAESLNVAVHLFIRDNATAITAFASQSAIRSATAWREFARHLILADRQRVMSLVTGTLSSANEKEGPQVSASLVDDLAKSMMQRFPTSPTFDPKMALGAILRKTRELRAGRGVDTDAPLSPAAEHEDFWPDESLTERPTTHSPLSAAHESILAELFTSYAAPDSHGAANVINGHPAPTNPNAGNVANVANAADAAISSKQPFFDGFTLRNARGMDCEALARAVAQNRSSKLTEEAADVQIALLRQKLVRLNIHPDYPIGSVKEAMATTLMRMSKQPVGERYVQYESDMALTAAWEKRYEQWIVEKDFPIVPSLAAGLYGATSNDVAFTPGRWYVDFWNEHIVMPLANAVEIAGASAIERQRLWTWLSWQTWGWNATTRSWEVSDASALARSVKAVVDLFYQLQLPENEPTYLYFAKPLPPLYGDLVYNVTYSSLLKGLPYRMQAGLFNVAKAFDLTPFKQDRILTDTWIRTAHRLIAYQDDRTQLLYSAEPVFDRRAVAYNALRANGVTPGGMTDASAQLIDARGVVVRAAVDPLEGFLLAAKDGLRLKLPQRSIMSPAAMLQNALDQFLNTIAKHPYVRARAFAQIRAKGLPFVPSVIKSQQSADTQAIRQKISATFTSASDHSQTVSFQLPAFTPLLPVRRANRIDSPALAPYAAFSVVRDGTVATRLAEFFSAPDRASTLAALFEVDTPSAYPLASLEVASAAIRTAWVSVRLPGAARTTFARPSEMMQFPHPGLLGSDEEGSLLQAAAGLDPVLTRQVDAAIHRRGAIEHAMASVSDLASVDAERWQNGVLGTARLTGDFLVDGTPVSRRETVAQVHGWFLRAPDSRERDVRALVTRHMNVRCDIHDSASHQSSPPDYVDAFAIINRAYAQSSQFRRLLNAYDDLCAIGKSIHVNVADTFTQVEVTLDQKSSRWAVRIPGLSHYLPVVVTEDGVMRQPPHQALLTALVQVLTGTSRMSFDGFDRERGLVAWWSDTIFMQWGDAYSARLTGQTLDSLPSLSVGAADIAALSDAAESEDRYLEQISPNNVVGQTQDRYLGNSISGRPTVKSVIALFERIDYPAPAGRTTTDHSAMPSRDALTRLDFVTRWRLAFTIQPGDLLPGRAAEIERFFAFCYTRSALFMTLFDAEWSYGKAWRICLDDATEACSVEVNRPFREVGAINADSDVEFQALGPGDRLQSLPLFRRLLELSVAALTGSYPFPPPAQALQHRGVAVWCTDMILNQAGWAVDKRTAQAVVRPWDEADTVALEAHARENRRAARVEDHFLLQWAQNRG